MEHYACAGGCNGVSSDQGICKTEGCSKFGESMDKCECGEAGHMMASAKEEPTSSEQPVEENK